jgi:hypothetical protein
MIASRLKVVALVAVCLASLGATAVHAPPPTVDDLKRVLEVRLKALMPKRFTTRTVLFEQVTPAAPVDGVYPFTVTANVHDYGAGSPAKKDYGQTCLRRMENWTFGLRADSAGGWRVEGRMTGADSVCIDNPAEGESAIPLESLVSSAATSLEEDAGNLPAGEWACYDANSQLMANLSFVLKASGKYTDASGARGGTFVYSGTRSEITFRGGFLGGQTGTNVQSSGFVLSPTVTCEPKK